MTSSAGGRRVARSDRRPLSEAESAALVDDLGRGRLELIENVQFPRLFQVVVRNLRGVRFRNVGLWLTVAKGLFRPAVVERCSFEHVDLDPLTVFGAVLSEVEFAQTTLGANNVGTIKDSRLRAVTLQGCTVNAIGVTKCIIEGADIGDGELNRVRFDGCDLSRSRVAATLDNVVFIRCSFERCDLGGSSLVDVAFLDSRSTDLALPQSRAGFIVPRESARAAVSPVLGELSPETKAKVLREVSDGGVELPSFSEALFRRELGASDLETELLVEALLPHALPTLAAAEPRP